MHNLKVQMLPREGGLNIDDDNVDVEITLPDGQVYSATFFTLANLKSLMAGYRKSGECANGLYVWAADMIVVEKLTRETIQKSIEDMVQTGEIYSACSRIR